MTGRSKYTIIFPESQHIELLSSSIRKKDSGDYPFHERILLTFLEPLRRDFMRGRRAVANFDPERYAWQAYYVHVWIREYLVPYIILFQEAQDKFIIPYYSRDRTFDFPPALANKDEYVYATCQRVKHLAEEIYRIVKKGDPGEIHTVPQLTDELKLLLPQLLDHMIDYYNVLELFMPPVYEYAGEVRGISMLYHYQYIPILLYRITISELRRNWRHS